MAIRFEESIEELQALLKTAGLKGKWEDDGQGKHTFRSNDGGVLNWWPTRGTVQLQGQDKAKSRLEKALRGEGAKAKGEFEQRTPSAQHQPKHIFIVHGHDSDAR